MSRGTWNLIIQSKRFYVIMFRRIGSIMLVSIFLNGVLGLLIGYVYLHQPNPDYYATYGETPPVPLVGMSDPNYSSVPLLANDISSDSNQRTVIH